MINKRIIASIAKCEGTKNKLLLEEKNVLYIRDEGVTLLPLGLDFTNLNVMLFSEYDIVEIRNNKVYKIFDVSSNENSIVVMNKCNENCVMCPCTEIWRNLDISMTVDEIMELIDYIPSDTRHLTLTGGEPTLVGYGFLKILDKINDHFDHIDIQILTNGRTFSNKQYFDELKMRIRSNMQFGIPIYGYNSTTHDSIVQTQGAFYETVSGIKKLLSCGANVELRIVVSRLNYKNMTKIAHFIVMHFTGLNSVKIMAMEMMGSAAKNREQLWIDYSEAFKASKDAIKLFLMNGIDVRLYNFPLCKVEEGYWGICSKSITSYKIEYNDSCNSCSVKSICGGVFKSTLKITNMHLEPVKGKYENTF